MTRFTRNLLQLAIIGVGLTSYAWWKNHQSNLSPTSQSNPANQQSLNEQTAQVISDAHFFTDKVAAGNWIFGTQAASLHLRAFRLTNDTSHLIAAKDAADQYIQHEDSSTAHALLSSVALTSHEFFEAESQAQQAFEFAQTSEESTEALAARFDAEAALGKISNLKQTAQELTITTPSYSQLTRLAHFADRVHGDFARAAELFTDACAYTADSDDTWNHAWCLTRQAHYQLLSGTPASDIETQLQIISQQTYPGFAPALALHGHLAAHDKDFSLSTNLYQQALRQSETPDIHLELAEIALRQNNTSTASESWQNYLHAIGAHRINTAASDNAIVHVRGLTQALSSLGNTDEALTAAQEDLNKRPQDPGAFQTLALVYIENNQYEQALEASQNITSDIILTPDESLVRGLILLNINREQEAQEHINYACQHTYGLSLYVSRLAFEKSQITCPHP